MKQLKFLFICLTLCVSSVKAQFVLTSLIKGQEFFNRNQNENSPYYISSQNENFKFSYNFTDKKWVISDNLTSVIDNITKAATEKPFNRVGVFLIRFIHNEKINAFIQR